MSVSLAFNKIIVVPSLSVRHPVSIHLTNCQGFGFAAKVFLKGPGYMKHS
jgi:hypothetical protein